MMGYRTRVSRRTMLGATAMAIAANGRSLAVFAQTPSADPLQVIKDYVSGNVEQLVAGTAALLAWAEQYYALAEASGFDYAAMWEANQADLPDMLAEGRAIWTDQAHGNYEFAEGIVAGVPSLADFDVWIDAGPTGEEDPANAYDWTLTLPDGTTFDKPGNIFHTVTEPALWGTNPDFVGLEADLDGNGTVDVTEALPDANVLLGGVQALSDAVTQLQAAVSAWEPTLSDLFTALVVMLPTAGGYFEEWRHSAYVVGNTSESENFVGSSRLLDVLGIYHGLQITWDAVAPLVAEVDAGLASAITVNINELIAFVQELYDNELAGTRYNVEEAEQFGAEVQQRGDTVAGQVTQAAALIGVELQEV